MKVSNILKENQGKTIFSFELLPPLKGQSCKKLHSTVEQLMEFDPKYINLSNRKQFPLQIKTI